MSKEHIIQLFYGPLDGLRFQAQGDMNIVLEFAYVQEDRNFRLNQDPSPLQPPMFFESYRLTATKSNDGHTIYHHMKEASRPPT